MTKGCKFPLYTLKFIGVGIRKKFQATEAYSNLDLTKTVYSIKSLSKVKKENVIVRINPSNFIVCENKKIYGLMEMVL
jgi:hypothetical protein